MVQARTTHRLNDIVLRSWHHHDIDCGSLQNRPSGGRLFELSRPREVDLASPRKLRPQLLQVIISAGTDASEITGNRH